MSDWPHSPPHRLTEQGAYMITCDTYGKAHFLNMPEKLDMFRRLFSTALLSRDGSFMPGRCFRTTTLSWPHRLPIQARCVACFPSCIHFPAESSMF